MEEEVNIEEIRNYEETSEGEE
jgi:hypothetical protein